MYDENELMQQQEQQHLDEILGIIDQRLQSYAVTAEQSRALAMESKRNLWRDLYELSGRADIVNARDEINESMDQAERAQAEIERLARQRNTPYFGRIDFDDDEEPGEFYIGLSGLRENGEILIFDWRAPVSSMFYDYDVGPAGYDAPMGRIDGQITLRRQYKINDGQLRYVLDSAIKIDDDILQQELARNASPRMRNIIATIQKEQNRIIRQDSHTTMVVQGVAGSGKTSVALHKVAYLLYHERGKITSRNLLILSPSQVFSDYISGVLPELGEENVAELSFDRLAENELSDLGQQAEPTVEGEPVRSDVPYEGRYEQLEYILRHGADRNDRRMQEIELKGSDTYVRWLQEYVAELLENNFRPRAWVYGDERFEAEEIRDLFYNRFANQPFMVRVDWIVERLVDELETRKGRDLGDRPVRSCERAVHRMIRCEDMLELYCRFIRWLRSTGRADLEDVIYAAPLRYEDLFPALLLKFYLKGSRDFSHIRHLVIDEMQDYTQVQYAIINYLFHCPKTILGDITQNLSLRSGVRSLDAFTGSMEQVEIVRLCKSFRSTWEIATFCNAICPAEGFEAVERHGHAPVVTAFSDVEALAAHLIALLEADHGYGSVGVICKTMDVAEQWYRRLRDRMPVELLGTASEHFRQGVVCTTAYMAKGLEFDMVIVPDADDDTYRTGTDRQSLYVACTRALHRLELLHTGWVSEFIERAQKKGV